MKGIFLFPCPQLDWRDRTRTAKQKLGGGGNVRVHSLGTRFPMSKTNSTWLVDIDPHVNDVQRVPNHIRPG